MIRQYSALNPNLPSTPGFAAIENVIYEMHFSTRCVLKIWVSKLRATQYAKRITYLATSLFLDIDTIPLSLPSTIRQTVDGRAGLRVS